MCGEHREFGHFHRATLELPPRTQRIQIELDKSSLEHGTTSTHAENTGRLLGFSGWLWNYLHIRGECAASRLEMTGCMELPPHARRIQHRRYLHRDRYGTTSACAENTRSRGVLALGRWNYLRVRGEYDDPDPKLYRFQELPPRARRIPGPALIACACGGTTSACAENTRLPRLLRRQRWNYLRVRGEYPRASHVQD